MAQTQTQVQAALNKGGVVVLEPGTHRFSNLVIPKGATLDGKGKATLEGSQVISGWRPEGELRSAPYSQLPVVDGHGIAFSKGQNLADPMGKHADQVWTRRGAGDGRLRRVATTGAVKRGTFAVAGGRLWVHKDDEALGIIASRHRVAIKNLSGTLKGVAVARYSPTPGDGAAILVKDGGRIESCTIDSCSFASVRATGSKVVIKDTALSRCGWMGIAAVLCTTLRLENVSWTKVNSQRMFTASPQSGALKTSRCRGVTLINPTVREAVGHGLWFDQSTTDVDISGGSIDATGNGVFFELSHALRMKNLTVKAGQDAVKVSGASGVRIDACRLTGGRYGLGVYVDPRSRPKWADPQTALTAAMKKAGVYASDRRPIAWRDTRITWMPRVESVSDSQIAGRRGRVFVLPTNGGAVSTKESMIPAGII
jgi:hypothetical protein